MNTERKPPRGPARPAPKGPGSSPRKPAPAGSGKPPRKPAPPSPEKPGLHPRNPHRERYDFPRLVKACPELARFLVTTPYGDTSVDFADPAAVKTLNRALLLCFYRIQGWDIPPGYLCPPIPGRADYLHHLADLLASERDGGPPRGPALRALDIGVGANCIYPLLGARTYGWSFLGSDTDPGALASARRILEANPDLAERIRLRRQKDPSRLLEGLLHPGEQFDVSLCNPPFHVSAREAREGSLRKWRNLGRSAAGAPVLNFGGQGGELWCEGGEAGFLERLALESARMPDACLWFSALVSKASTLEGLRRTLRAAGARELRVIPMAQGQKRSRILAWTFLDPAARKTWAARWGCPAS